MDSLVDTISTRGQAKGSFIKHPIQKRYITQEDEDQECADLLDMDIENKLGMCVSWMGEPGRSSKKNAHLI
jgi:hypothetical protein